MPTSFIDGSKRAVVAVALILIAVVAAAAYVIQEQADIRMRLDKTREVINQAKEQQAMVLTYEANYRALLSASDKGIFYEACKALQKPSDMAQTALRSLAAEDASNGSLVTELFDLQKQLTGEPLSDVGLANLSRVQIQQILQNRHKLLGSYRSVSNHLISDQQAKVTSQREQAKLFRELFYSAFAALCIGGLGGLWWLYHAIDRYVTEKTSALLSMELKNEDLQKARDEAVRANLLKSQFVANISHEIRTPMNGILGLSELLSQTESDEDGMAKHIHDSALSLMRILNDLLDFSKLEAGRMQLTATDFNTAVLVKEVADFMAVSFAAKGVELKTSVSQELDQDYIGDRDRIRQVLLNFVHNALKFTSVGKVTVKASIDKYYENEAFVRFEVTDTGEGIPVEAKKKLFEPFMQADMSSTRRHGGTGLGLSISKSLVELMNGAIDCQSVENEGSTFSFVVPLAPKTLPADRPVAPTVAAAATSRETTAS